MTNPETSKVIINPGILLTKTEMLRERIARKMCRQSATSLYSRWYENPNNARENEVWFKRADQILQACKEAGMKFVPDEWAYLPDLHYEISGNWKHGGVVQSETIQAINSQIKEIEL